MTSNVRVKWLVRLFSLGLALAGTAYIARGLQQLVLPSSRSQAKDLRTNWEEERLFLHGISPYRMSSPYPPWTFPANVLFYWPPWPQVRIYWAAINLICLATLAFWAAWIASQENRQFTWVLTLSVPAIATVATGMGVGQNAIVYTTLSVLGLMAAGKRREISGGILMGIALSKVSLTLPFLLPLLAKRRFKTVSVAALFAGASWLLAGMILGESPLVLMKQWVGFAKGFESVGYGPVSFLHDAGLDSGFAAPCCASISLGIGALGIMVSRRLPMLTLCGAAAAVARLWAYHRLYDNFVLVMLLVALGDAWLRLKRPTLLVAFVATGLTLWLPPGTSDWRPIQIIHVCLWTAAAIALLTVTGSGARSDREPGSSSSTCDPLNSPLA